MRTINSIQELQEAKRLTANEPVSTTHYMTGFQMYQSFCFRMTKFDNEFATLEPPIAQVWLNIGMQRLLHELEKRYKSDDTDPVARRVMIKYIKDFSFNADLDNCIEGEIYRFNEPSLAEIGSNNRRLIDEPFDFVVTLVQPIALNTFEYDPGDDDPEQPTDEDAFNAGVQYPLIFPHRIMKSVPEDPDDLNWYVIGSEFNIDAVELDNNDVVTLRNIVFNSHSLLMNGERSKIYFYRDKSNARVEIYVGDRLLFNRSRQTGSFLDNCSVPALNKDNQYYTYWKVNNVTAQGYKVEDLYAACFISVTEGDVSVSLPVELHTDVVDYAIDAYFESIFFQSFGKYSQKQARQDMVDPASGSSLSSSRQGKLDAVPPQRYRLR
jgi:hypothetical protein